MRGGVPAAPDHVTTAREPTVPTTFLDLLVPDGLDPLEVGRGGAAVLSVPPHPDDLDHPPAPLWLVGEVDLVTAPALAACVRAALCTVVDGPVVVDVSRVTFMDLDGLRMLLRLRTDLSADGRELVLRAPSAPVRLLLRVARPWARLIVLDDASREDPTR